MRDPVWVLDLGAVDPGSRGAVVVFWVGCSVLAGGCYMTIWDWVRPGDEVFVTRGLEKELVNNRKICLRRLLNNSHYLHNKPVN